MRIFVTVEFDTSLYGIFLIMHRLPRFIVRKKSPCQWKFEGTALLFIYFFYLFYLEPEYSRICMWRTKTLFKLLYKYNMLIGKQKKRIPGKENEYFSRRRANPAACRSEYKINDP